MGSIDRGEFADVVRSRGGGLSGDLLVDAVQRVEDRVGAPVLVRRATLDHLSVSLTVSTSDRPEESDDWIVGGSVRGPLPASNLDDDQQRQWFTVSALDPETIETAIDAAVADSDIRDAWASGARFDAAGEDTFVATVTVTNQRGSESWTFGPEGRAVRSAS
ncbi:MAG TPA: hypothetical protein VK866_02955 [Acidimicrobiales bacterium]|nr:hypothetical protein [Acidimicrobiales bacterium]